MSVDEEKFYRFLDRCAKDKFLKWIPYILLGLFVGVVIGVCIILYKLLFG